MSDFLDDKIQNFGPDDYNRFVEVVTTQLTGRQFFGLSPNEMQDDEYDPDSNKSDDEAQPDPNDLDTNLSHIRTSPKIQPPEQIFYEKLSTVNIDYVSEEASYIQTDTQDIEDEANARMIVQQESQDTTETAQEPDFEADEDSRRVEIQPDDPTESDESQTDEDEEPQFPAGRSESTQTVTYSNPDPLGQILLTVHNLDLICKTVTQVRLEILVDQFKDCPKTLCQISDSKRFKQLLQTKTGSHNFEEFGACVHVSSPRSDISSILVQPAIRIVVSLQEHEAKDKRCWPDIRSCFQGIYTQGGPGELDSYQIQKSLMTPELTSRIASPGKWWVWFSVSEELCRTLKPDDLKKIAGALFSDYDDVVDLKKNQRKMISDRLNVLYHEARDWVTFRIEMNDVIIGQGEEVEPANLQDDNGNAL